MARKWFQPSFESAIIGPRDKSHLQPSVCRSRRAPLSRDILPSLLLRRRCRQPTNHHHSQRGATCGALSLQSRPNNAPVCRRQHKPTGFKPASQAAIAHYAPTSPLSASIHTNHGNGNQRIAFVLLATATTLRTNLSFSPLRFALPVPYSTRSLHYLIGTGGTGETQTQLLHHSHTVRQQLFTLCVPVVRLSLARPPSSSS